MRKFYLLLVALICAFTANAESYKFGGGKQFFFFPTWVYNGTDANDTNHAILKATFKDGNTEETVLLTKEGTVSDSDGRYVYSCDVPIGTWSQIKVVRHNYNDLSAWNTFNFSTYTPGRVYTCNSAQNGLEAVTDAGASVAVIHDGETKYYNSSNHKSTFEVNVPLYKNDEFFFFVSGKKCGFNGNPDNDGSTSTINKTTTISWAKNGSTTNFTWTDASANYNVKINYKDDNPYSISFAQGAALSHTPVYKYYLNYGGQNKALTESNGNWTLAATDYANGGDVYVVCKDEGDGEKEEDVTYKAQSASTITPTPQGVSVNLKSDASATTTIAKGGNYGFSFNPTTGVLTVTGTPKFNPATDYTFIVTGKGTTFGDGDFFDTTTDSKYKFTYQQYKDNKEYVYNIKFDKFDGEFIIKNNEENGTPALKFGTDGVQNIAKGQTYKVVANGSHITISNAKNLELNLYYNPNGDSWLQFNNWEEDVVIDPAPEHLYIGIGERKTQNDNTTLTYGIEMTKTAGKDEWTYTIPNWREFIITTSNATANVPNDAILGVQNNDGLYWLENKQGNAGHVGNEFTLKPGMTQPFWMQGNNMAAAYTMTVTYTASGEWKMKFTETTLDPEYYYVLKSEFFEGEKPLPVASAHYDITAPLNHVWVVRKDRNNSSENTALYAAESTTITLGTPVALSTNTGSSKPKIAKSGTYAFAFDGTNLTVTGTEDPVTGKTFIITGAGGTFYKTTDDETKTFTFVSENNGVYTYTLSYHPNHTFKVKSNEDNWNLCFGPGTNNYVLENGKPYNPTTNSGENNFAAIDQDVTFTLVYNANDVTKSTLTATWGGSTGGNTGKLYLSIDPGSGWEYSQIEMKPTEGKDNEWTYSGLKPSFYFMITTEKKESDTDFWKTGCSYILGAQDYVENDKYSLTNTSSLPINPGNGKPFYLSTSNLKAASYTLTVRLVNGQYSLQLSATGSSTGGEYVDYYFQGDMNFWSSPENNVSPSTGAKKHVYVTKDGTNEINSIIWPGDVNRPYYLTKEELQAWRFRKVNMSTLPENLQKILKGEEKDATGKTTKIDNADDWVYLSFKNLTDGNGHKNRLCGQYHIVVKSYEEGEERWAGEKSKGIWVNINVNTMNDIYKCTTTTNNLRNNCNYIEDAVIYFNPKDKKIFVTGTEKDIYFYYTHVNHPTDKPSALSFSEKVAQVNYTINGDVKKVNTDDENMKKVASADYKTSDGRTITFKDVYRVKLPNSSEHRFPAYFLLDATGCVKQTITTQTPVYKNPLYIRTSENNWSKTYVMNGSQDDEYQFVLPNGSNFMITTNGSSEAYGWNKSSDVYGVNENNNYNWLIDGSHIGEFAGNGKQLNPGKDQPFKIEAGDGNYLIKIKKSENSYNMVIEKGGTMTKTSPEVDYYETSTSEGFTHITPQIACDDVWMIETDNVNVYFRYGDDRQLDYVKSNIYYNEYNDQGGVSNRVYNTGSATAYNEMKKVEGKNIVINDYSPADAQKHTWWLYEGVKGTWALDGNAIFVAKAHTEDGDAPELTYPVNGINATESDLLQAAINGVDLWYVVPRTIEGHLLYSHAVGTYQIGQGAINVQGEVWETVGNERKVVNDWDGKYKYDFRITQIKDKDGNTVDKEIFDDENIWVPFMVDMGKGTAANHNGVGCTPYPWKPTEDEVGVYLVELTVTDTETGESDYQREEFPVYANGDPNAGNKYYISFTYNEKSQILEGHHTAAGDDVKFSWVKWSSGNVSNDELNEQYGDDGAIEKNETNKHYCTNFSDAYYRVYAESKRNVSQANAPRRVQGWSSADTRVAMTTFVPNNTTGIEAILAEKADTDAPVEYFNLQGVRLINPTPGQVVIRRQGTQVTKMIVR